MKFEKFFYLHLWPTGDDEILLINYLKIIKLHNISLKVIYVINLAVGNECPILLQPKMENS